MRLSLSSFLIMMVMATILIVLFHLALTRKKSHIWFRTDFFKHHARCDLSAHSVSDRIAVYHYVEIDKCNDIYQGYHAIRTHYRTFHHEDISDFMGDRNHGSRDTVCA